MNNTRTSPGWPALAISAMIIAISVAASLYILLSPKVPATPTPVSNNRAADTDAVSLAEKIQAMVSFHAFGRANLQDTPSAHEMKETEQQLELTGILASSSTQAAQALIRSNDGLESTYGIDSILPGGVLLKQIHADHVILEHNGVLEKLVLTRREVVVPQ